MSFAFKGRFEVMHLRPQSHCSGILNLERFILDQDGHAVRFGGVSGLNIQPKQSVWRGDKPRGHQRSLLIYPFRFCVVPCPMQGFSQTAVHRGGWTECCSLSQWIQALWVVMMHKQNLCMIQHILRVVPKPGEVFYALSNGLGLTLKHSTKGTVGPVKSPILHHAADKEPKEQYRQN